jgi:hypothetical protein
MRIIGIGDIHGRTTWKQIVEKETFDKVVFVGDYFDTHDDVSPEQQKQNFRDIVAYKKANMDKVVLLFGNHDYHYLRTVTETYSGYQQFQKVDISEMLHQAIDEDLLQMCFVFGNVIYSHAGITETWCNNNLVQIESIEDSVNELFKYKPQAFRFTPGENYSNHGDDVEQSPIWVRPVSILNDKVNGYIHVVGHTTQDKIVFTDAVILIDTLGTSGEYLILDEEFGFSIGRSKY